MSNLSRLDTREFGDIHRSCRRGMRPCTEALQAMGTLSTVLDESARLRPWDAPAFTIGVTTAFRCPVPPFGTYPSAITLGATAIRLTVPLSLSFTSTFLRLVLRKVPINPRGGYGSTFLIGKNPARFNAILRLARPSAIEPTWYIGLSLLLGVWNLRTLSPWRSQAVGPVTRVNKGVALSRLRLGLLTLTTFWYGLNAG
jgi:hypothetical protein